MENKNFMTVDEVAKSLMFLSPMPTRLSES